MGQFNQEIIMAKRIRIINAKVTEKEYRTIKATARRWKMSISEFVRNSLGIRR